MTTAAQFMDMCLTRSREWFLVDGKVISLEHPPYWQCIVRSNIWKVLERLSEQTEAQAFTPLPSRLDPWSVHAADVALPIDPRRGQVALRNDDLIEGAPELVIEIESVPNTAYDVDALELACYARGCQSFWKVVREPSYSVRVGRSLFGRLQHQVFKCGDTMPFDLLGVNAGIATGSFFEDLL